MKLSVQFNLQYPVSLIAFKCVLIEEAVNLTDRFTIHGNSKFLAQQKLNIVVDI